jgi:hypothetical protein
MGDFGKTSKPGTRKGSSARKGFRTEMVIPVNIERVILFAAREPQFKARLMQDPAAAIGERGFELTSSERAMIASMSPLTLEALVRRFRPDRLKRARFARRVAATVGGAMLLSTAACGTDSGGREDTSEDVAEEDMPMVDAGVDTSWPDTDDVVWDTPVVDAGVDTSMPDLPPDTDEDVADEDAGDVEDEDVPEEG